MFAAEQDEDSLEIIEAIAKFDLLLKMSLRFPSKLLLELLLKLS